MTPTETVRMACISVGIDPDMAEAAAIAHARMTAAPSSSEAGNAMAEAVRVAFNFKNPPTRRMTASDVCKAIGINEPTRAQQTAMGYALVRVTKRKALKSNGRHVYVMPEQNRATTLP